MLLLHKKFFYKNRGLVLASLTHFLLDFWRKILLTLNFINWLNFIVWLSSLFNILSNVSCNYLLFSLWVHKFWKWPWLPYQVLFLHNQSVWKETYIFQEQKQLFTGNKKHFSSFFIKGFQLSETASGVRVGH